MRKKDQRHALHDSTVVNVGRFLPNLDGRQTIEVELPRFPIVALRRRVVETNEELPPDEQCTLNDYIESELVNLVTLRDVAELEIELPGFSAAVKEWIIGIGE